MRVYKYEWILYFLILLLFNACSGPSKAPAPPRNFTTLDLLLSASSLPKTWKGELLSQPDRCNAYDYQNCIEAAVFSFRGNISINQYVARFLTDFDADVAYSNHNFTVNSNGDYWAELDGFNYRSPYANQYRVECQTRALYRDCVIESRYDEYVVITQYVAASSYHDLDDLLIIAKAIDMKLDKYLKTSSS